MADAERASGADKTDTAEKAGAMEKEVASVDVETTSATARGVDLTSEVRSLTIEDAAVSVQPSTTGKAGEAESDAGERERNAEAVEPSAPVLQRPVESSLPVDVDVAPVVLEARPAGAAVPVAPLVVGGAPRSWRHRGEVEDATTQLSWNRSCVFCEIVAGKKDAQVVYEDERFLAFKDIRPAGEPHYQVIPKHHIRDITALRPDAHDIEMVEAMIAIGSMLVARDHPQRNGASRLAFHRPPLISVRHLHLHTIGLPLRGIGYLKHGAIFRWSADANSVLADLRKQAAAT